MIFLVDNGSVEPEAYKNLCSIADRLSKIIGRQVVPAPLLHANKIPADLLMGGTPEILENLIKKAFDQGTQYFTVLPLFFGDSGALVDYLPRRLEIIGRDRPGFQIRILKPLFNNREDGGADLAGILEEQVVRTIDENNLETCQVIVVDHGSPRREVTEVRNEVATLLGEKLGAMNLLVVPASMERRSGKEYDFNEPLLSDLLIQKPFNSGNTIVAQLFLSPGRHAGPGGDIEQICCEAEKDNEGLKIFRTEVIGSHSSILEILNRRWKERNLTQSVQFPAAQG